MMSTQSHSNPYSVHLGSRCISPNLIDQLSTIFAIVINTHLTSNNNEKTVTREIPTAEESNFEGSNLALCFTIIKLTLDLQQNGRVKVSKFL